MFKAQNYCKLQRFVVRDARMYCKLQYFLVSKIGKSFPSSAFFSQRLGKPSNYRRNPAPSVPRPCEKARIQNTVGELQQNPFFCSNGPQKRFCRDANHRRKQSTGPNFETSEKYFPGRYRPRFGPPRRGPRGGQSGRTLLWNVLFNTNTNFSKNM